MLTWLKDKRIKNNKIDYGATVLVDRDAFFLQKCLTVRDYLCG